MTRWPGKRVLAAPLIFGLVAAACGGSATPATSVAPSSDTPSPAVSGSRAPSPDAGDPIAVGPVAIQAEAIDPGGDVRLALAVLDRADRGRVRSQAGFARESGTGWEALATSIDLAVDAAVGVIAADLGISVPTAGLDRSTASIGAPIPVEPIAPGSAASAMAIVSAALTAGQGLGSGGTRETSTSETRTTTDGDDVATTTIKARGKVTSTGSRVEADFTFEISGNVTNRVSGATAQLSGTATAHVEIDGCPDANGSSKGKMSLSSRESVTGQHDGGEGTASWTRDLSGDFDIHVDDEAQIAGLVVNTSAQESVTSSERETGDDDAERDGHDLGVNLHYEYASRAGFEGLAPIDSAVTGDVTHQRNADRAHLASLVKSAAYAISVAAISLGQAAEKFWRDGKCVELIVDPEGGDVDADSVSDVVARLKHRFEGTELDKPVKASLAGVMAIDPAADPQPAPATVKYTAGSSDGDVGEIAFESVSNRGIARKTVKFTVRPATWDVTFKGTQKEVLGPVSNSFAADITGLRISGKDGVLSGSGKMHLRGVVTSGTCSGTLDYVAPVSVTGTLVGTGPAAVLRIVFTASSPPGLVTHLRCKPGGGADIPAEGYAERFGEPLREVELPAAGGTLRVAKQRSVGGVLSVTVSGTFAVTRAGAG